MNVDISALVNPLVAVAGTVLAAVATSLVNKAITAFQKRTDIQLTDLQRNTVLGAVNTAAGLVNVAMQKGALKIDDVHVDNPLMAEIADVALAGVQTSAAALGVTRASAINMIVGQVGRALGTPTPAMTGVAYLSGIPDAPAPAPTPVPPDTVAPVAPSAQGN